MTTSKHAAQRNQTALLILVEQTFSRKHQLAGTITGIRRVEKSAWKNRRWSAGTFWRETKAPSSLIIHDDYARGREGVKFTTRDIAATSFSPIKAWSDCGLLTADLRFTPWQGRVHTRTPMHAFDRRNPDTEDDPCSKWKWLRIFLVIEWFLLILAIFLGVFLFFFCAIIERKLR